MFQIPILLEASSLNKSHGLTDIIFKSHPIVQVTLFILILFSIISWAIIFFKFFQLKNAQKNSEHFFDSFENSVRLDDLTKSQFSSPLQEILTQSLNEISRAQSSQIKLQFSNLQNKIARQTQQSIEKLGQMLPFLASTASASPFIGLFGTVCGILLAFSEIGQQGSTSLAVVGPFISEALVATAVGLAAAIPAVMAYNYFANKIRQISSTAEQFSEALLSRLQRELF